MPRLKEKEASAQWIKNELNDFFILYITMQPKINVQDCLIGALAGFGAFIIFNALYEKNSLHFSWGSDMCNICNRYECETYDYFCDDCADDVKEEFHDKAEKNLSMYN